MEYRRIVSKEKIIVDGFYIRQHAVVRLCHGYGHISINGNLIEAPDNSCIIIPKFSFISCSLDKIDNRNIELYLLIINDDAMKNALSHINDMKQNSYTYSTVIDTPPVVANNFALLQQSTHSIKNERIEQALLSQCMFFILCSLNDAKVNIFSLYHFDNEQPKKQVIIRLITHEPQRQWAFKEMAYILALSPTALRRYLKSEGLVFHQLLLDIRMGLALNHLTFTRYSILKISHLVGFKSNAYFCHMFKKTYGLTASAFRNASQGSAGNR